MKKRILSLVMVLCMMFTLLPGNVFAAETGSEEITADYIGSVTALDGSVTQYTDLASALSAAQSSSGSTLTLLSDAVSDNGIGIASKMTLDLNGYTLDMGSNHLRVDYYDTYYGELTITDSSAEETGTITGDDYYLLDILGRLIIDGGTFQANSSGSFALMCRTHADVIINRGTFIGARKDVGFSEGAKSLTINGGIYTGTGLQADVAGVILKGGTFSSIQAQAGAVMDSLLADGYCYYQGSTAGGTEADGSGRILKKTVTVGEIDWSGAVTYDAEQKTYTVLSADGLRWVAGVCNGTVTADTYQNDPALPADIYFTDYTVKLANDINLSEKNWTPIGAFKGTFDGAGHSITNMTVNVSDDSNFVYGGFFATLGGLAKNLSVSGSINVTGGESSTVYAGGIAANVDYERADGSLYNCLADVDVSITVASGQSGEAGGLAGEAVRAEVFNCISKGTVTINGAGTSVAGALLGRAAMDALENCYVATGTLVGNNESSIYTSVGTYDTSTGTLTATDGTTLTYGSDLKTAVKYWVNRQGADAVNYVTWTTDNIPALTTTYAAVSAPVYSNWEKQEDGSYTRTDSNTGLTETAEACVTNGDTETLYETLEEAIAAASGENGTTVKLLTDMTTESTVNVDSGTFTIDLNGRTWRSTVTGDSNSALCLKGDSHVTLKDSVGTGTLTSTSGDNSSTIYVQGVSATIESGTYNNTGTGWALHTSQIDNSGQRMVINGGTFKNSDGGNSPVHIAVSNATITGGTFETDGIFIWNCKDVDITGGTFTKITTYTYGEEGIIKTVGELLGDGYAYCKTGDNTWVSSVSGNDITNVAVKTAPVQITFQPEDTEVTYGYSAAPVLSVTAQRTDGVTSDITYQWYKDNTILTGETDSSYTMETGLAVGGYSYYCAVTCDGYTLNSSTAVMTVNPLKGSITNKDYPVNFTYTGEAITNPTDSNFTFNVPEGTLVYTWYSGDSTADSNRISGSPSEVGTYTLKVTSSGNAVVTSAEYSMQVDIKYLETDYVPVKISDKEWYNKSDLDSEVYLNTSSSDYVIRLEQDADWYDDMYINDVVKDINGNTKEGQIEVLYQLRNPNTLEMTDFKSIIFNIDVTAPVIDVSNIKYSEHQSFLGWLFHNSSIEVTVPVSDAVSGADHISYVLTPENGTPQAQTASVDSNGNAVFTVAKDFKGTIAITAYDKAGNASAAEDITKMAVEDTAPALTVNDGTVEFTDSWYTTAQTLHISAEDTGSGIRSVTCAVDGGDAIVLFTEADTDEGLTGSKEGLTVTALEGTHTYTITVTDNALNSVSKPVTIHQDTVAPVLKYIIAPQSSTLTDTTASIIMKASEAGSLYYIVQKSGDAPAKEVLLATERHDMVSGSKNTISLSGLERNTEYTLYVAARDEAGNQSGQVTEISFQTTKSTIAGAEVVLAADSYTYNGESQIPDVTVNTGKTTLSPEQYSISYSNSNGGNGDTTDAGTVTVTVTAAEDSDYTGTATAAYVIGKKKVTVTAADATKQYGQVNPALVLQPITSGQLVGDDTAEDFYITLSTTAKSTSEAGTYVITGTAKSANYEVTVNKGTLTITKIVPTLKVATTAITKTYGDKAFSLGAATAGTAKLSYKSSSTAIATVSSAGKVTIKGCGKVTITVTAAGTSYNTAAKTITLKVKPKTMGTPSLKASGSKKLTVDWKKDSKVSGYQITYSTSSKFTSITTKTVTVTSYKTLTKTISKLKSGQKYYIKIRSYKKFGNETIYGSWSKASNVEVK